MTTAGPQSQLRIAVANLKGGVGKSTTAMMVADALSALHAQKVLLVDLDAQANLSQMVLSYDGLLAAEAQGKTVTQWVRKLAEGEAPNLVDHTIVDASGLTELHVHNGHAGSGCLAIVPSTPELRFSELEFDHRNYVAGMQHVPRERMMKCISDGLAAFAGHFDVIVFDCPPGFTTLAQAALCSSGKIISPAMEERSGIWSLKAFRDFGLKKTLNCWSADNHRVLYTRVSGQGAKKEKAEIRQAISSAGFNTFDMTIKETSDAHKWTYRAAPDSFRSFNSKYASQKHAVKALGGEIMTFMRTTHNAEELPV